MIENIEVRNFKSLKNIVMKSRPLNLLAGLNGMGKSSLIQILLTIAQSERLGVNGQLNLKGRLIDIGRGKDALYQFAEDETICFNLALKDGKQWNWSFSFRPDWELLESESDVFPKFDSPIFNHLQYISADRLGPKLLHEVSQSSLERGDFGTKGEFAIHFLLAKGRTFKVDSRLKHQTTEDLSLINQVNGWLSEISPGVRICISEVPGVDKAILTYDFELGIGRTASFQPINVGFGISFCVSVILALLTAKENELVIIENPEAHIHPRGQARLGRLMALCAASGAQLFIETHSDHIINGVRVAVKEKLIGRDDVTVCWFKKRTTDKEQFSELTQIGIDDRGELSEYPDDFLDEWNNQLLKLV